MAITTKADPTLIDFKRGIIRFDVIEVDDETTIETVITSGKISVPDGVAIPVPKAVQRAINRNAKATMERAESVAISEGANRIARSARLTDRIADIDAILNPPA